LVLHSALHAPSLDILSKLSQFISLVEFHLENVIFGDESSQFGQTMSTGSSVTHQQTMSFGQFDDSVDFTDVVDGVLEQHDVHLGSLSLFIVFLQLVLHNTLQFVSFGIADLLIHVRRIFVKEVNENSVFLFLVGAFFHVGQKHQFDLFSDDLLHLPSVFHVH